MWHPHAIKISKEETLFLVYKLCTLEILYKCLFGGWFVDWMIVSLTEKWSIRKETVLPSQLSGVGGRCSNFINERLTLK